MCGGGVCVCGSVCVYVYACLSACTHKCAFECSRAYLYIDDTWCRWVWPLLVASGTFFLALTCSPRSMKCLMCR